MSLQNGTKIENIEEINLVQIGISLQFLLSIYFISQALSPNLG